MATCTVCGNRAGLLMSMCDACIAKQEEASRAESEALRGQRAPRLVHATCAACGEAMEALGRLPLRMGGSSGGLHLLLGEWADVGEAVVALHAARCMGRRRVELYDLDLILPSP